MKKLLYFSSCVVVAYVGITYYLSGLVLETPDRDLATTKRLSVERWNFDIDSVLATLPPYEEIYLPATAGEGKLRAWYFDQPGDTSDCAVIFAHGYSSTVASMVKYLPQFARCGCDLLVYEHRGHGRSYGAYASGGYYESHDLLGVHAWLGDTTGLGDDRIGWFGESWGAATALQAGGVGEVRPAFIVAESPYERWRSAILERGHVQYGAALDLFVPGTFAWVRWRNGIGIDAADTRALAGRIKTTPVLLFHSQSDDFTSPWQSDSIAAAVRPELLTYHRLDWGAWHAHNVLARRGEYERLVADFLPEGFCP